jgi:Protein of unknown function (DUF2855)
MGESK